MRSFFSRLHIPKFVTELQPHVFYFIKLGTFVHVFHTHVAEISMCQGPSMLPTFNIVGDFLLIDKLSTKWSKNIHLGDVVVATSLVSPDRIVCKRVLGLPGDKVCINPTVPVNQLQYLIVPPGYVWLAGDNLSNSTDSRDYGPVPIPLIRGRVLARVYPDPKWTLNGTKQSSIDSTYSN